MGNPPPPTWQVSSPVHAMHAQFVSVFATHAPPQQLSPGSPGVIIIPGVGARHGRPVEPQPQTLALHVSPALHARPHAPQFAASLAALMQAPPQHAWPALHAEPDVPHAHTPAVQLSPSAHARPIEPQFIGSVSVLTQVNEPLPSATHDWPEGHWS